jgi:hypothetical protein
MCGWSRCRLAPVAGLVALKNACAPPKTPLPTDALSAPWSGDWTTYAPFGTPSPSSSQHSYDSNSGTWSLFLLSLLFLRDWCFFFFFSRQVSGSRLCSPRKAAYQQRCRASPPTSPPPLSGKRKRKRGRRRRVRCPTATRTRTCRSRRWSHVCRLLLPLLLLRCPRPRPLPRRNGASRPRPSRSPTPCSHRHQHAQPHQLR